MATVKEPDRHLNTALVAANHERKRALGILGKELNEATEAKEKVGEVPYLEGRISALRWAINKITGG